MTFTKIWEDHPEIVNESRNVLCLIQINWVKREALGEKAGMEFDLWSPIYKYRDQGCGCRLRRGVLKKIIEDCMTDLKDMFPDFMWNLKVCVG